MILESIAERVSANVKVVVRVRPPNNSEINGLHRNVIEIMNENVLVFDPNDEGSPSYFGRGKRHRDIQKRRRKDLKFAFDFVFSATASNEEVFKQTTQSVLEGLLCGYNCSVFAYGATGAGKTHTMLGTETHPGVIYHTMIQLYQQIESLSQEKTCDIAVSYLEVYNEQIRDLLLPHGTLPIREDSNAGVIIQGLSLHKPNNAEELLRMLQFGNKNRTQHPTDANSESSRSHAVFQVFVRQRDRTANLSAEVKVAKMCLIDLAGSERATVTKNRGARFREGANINRSLLALGNVINALADLKYKGHIPYRDSKLTRILKDSLGGNCHTIMIAAVSPSSLSYEDTYNTLKYADRAKNIRLNMKKNVLNVDFHVSQYGQIVKDLRKEITELKNKLCSHEMSRASQSLSLSLPASIEILREGLQHAYQQRCAVRGQQLQEEMALRDVQWRLYRKQKCLQRAMIIANDQPQVLQKIQSTIHGLEQKLSGQEVQRQSLLSQLLDNTNDIHKLHTKAQSSDVKNSPVSQLLEVSIQKLGLESEANDSRHYIHHLKRLARAQEREAHASERLILALLRLVQRQQQELQSRDIVPSDISSSYKTVREMVGECGISWADAEGSGDCDSHSFHINNIIDLPMLSLPARPMPITNKSNSLSNCYGRVVNGKVTFPVPHSANLMSSDPGHEAKPALSQNTVRQLVPCSNKLPLCQVAVGETKTHDGCDSEKNRILARNSEYSAVLTHPGHTLASKNVNSNIPHYLPSITKPQETLKDCQTFYSKCLSSCVQNCQSINVKTSSLPNSKQHSLNETFSLDEEDHTELKSETHSPSVSCITAVALESSTPLTLNPLPKNSDSQTDNFRCLVDKSVLIKSSALSKDEVTKCSVSNKVLDSVNIHNYLKEPLLDSTLTPKPNSPVYSGDGSDIAINQRFSITSKTVTRVPSEKMVEPLSKEKEVEDKENNIGTRLHSLATRSINFDGVVLSPMRVEGRSYADVLKTPSPVRLPLQSLDTNSPQLVSGKCLNPEDKLAELCSSASQQSLYMPSPRALDNIRQLKQFGLPSLVENLITIHKPGYSLPANTGSVSHCVKPSYMQPTKSVSQRSRHLLKSSDDCFQTKLQTGRRQSHVRSKSASTMQRIGWKI